METYSLSSMVLALIAGFFAGFWGGRLAHWSLFQRIVSIDGYLRANAARAGKIAAKETAQALALPTRLEDMTEMDILREAQARGMLHTQQVHRRSGE